MWRDEDVDAAFQIYSDENVMRFLGSPPETSRKQVAERICLWRKRVLETSMGCYAAVTQSGEVVGNLLAKTIPRSDGRELGEVEVGWHVAFDFWGRGYGTDIAKSAISHGKELGHSPIAVVEKGNHASLRVASKAGLTRIGVTNNYYGGISLVLFRLDPAVD